MEHTNEYAVTVDEWTAESATGVRNARHDDAVKHAARVILGWEV